MTERTEATSEIGAPPAEVMAVIVDFEAYPDWAKGIREARVLERDARGRPATVAFHVSMAPVETRYTLAYRYAPRGRGLSWTTVEASGAVRSLEGEYVLEPGEQGTIVTYRLVMETGLALPGFLRRRAERTIVDTALGALKRRVEGG